MNPEHVASDSGKLGYFEMFSWGFEEEDLLFSDREISDSEEGSDQEEFPDGDEPVDNDNDMDIFLIIRQTTIQIINLFGQ